VDAFLDCYAGAYGLTIRFDANTLDDLRTLREALRRLALGPVEEVALHRLEGLRVLNLEALTLAVMDVEPAVSLRRLHGRTFLWVHTRYGWDTCCCLVDRLFEVHRPGHVYLTSEDVDDALVEVCLYERNNEADPAV
jgi:hypothetical protein